MIAGLSAYLIRFEEIRTLLSWHPAFVTSASRHLIEAQLLIRSTSSGLFLKYPPHSELKSLPMADLTSQLISCAASSFNLSISGFVPSTRIIATGADYHRLNAEGRDEFEGSGVYYAATAREAQLCSGSTVVVAGGGNSAGQAAMFLSEHTVKVLLVIRGDGLAKSMSSYLAHRVETKKNIEILPHTIIREMTGRKVLEAVELENTKTNERRTVETPAVFSMIGDLLEDARVLDLFAGSGADWDGASFFPVTTEEGRPLDNPSARLRLKELEERLDADRLVLNEGHFFDKRGRRLTVEEITVQ